MNFEQAAKMKKGIAAVLAILVISFVVFVLVRNDWAVDTNDLSGAVKKALGTRTVAEQQQSILVQLDVTPAEVFKQRLKNGKIVTVVLGKIQNTSKYPMEKVLVEGRLLGPTKTVHTITPPVPCGKTASKKELAGMGMTQVEEFYKENKQPFNCSINSGEAAPLMVVFDTLPSNFNSTFEFEVHPHSGQFIE